jgi:hypothetical protein
MIRLEYCMFKNLPSKIMQNYIVEKYLWGFFPARLATLFETGSL